RNLMCNRPAKFSVYLLSIVLCAPGIWLDAQAPSSPEGFQEYRPNHVDAGVIRSWGHVFVSKAMKSWERGFQQYHPDVTFEDNLVSSAAATGALFTNTADLGVLGREIRPMEVAGYARVMKQKPFPLEVM